MSWLNGLRLALWKEWRDHRAMLLALLVTLPALTALGFWAFGERLGGAGVGTQAAIIVPVALGLVLFAIAGDLMAGEHRRGTFDVLRRIPGARSQAFVAKWMLLIATLFGSVLWLSLAWLVAWNIRGETMQLMALEKMLAQFPGGMLWHYFFLGAVICVWAFVVAHWLARSGAAAIASVLVLGLLLAPVAWVFWTHPWFMPFGPVHVPAIGLVLMLVAVAVSALSWFVGLRFHGAVWRPGLLGLGAVLLLSGVGYAYTAQKLADYSVIDPRAIDFQIKQAFISPNGERLYMNVHRGNPWYAGRPAEHYRVKRADWFRLRGSPVQAWILDLETGAVTRDATDGHHAYSIVTPSGYSFDRQGNRFAPHGVIGRLHFPERKTTEVRWIDTDSGETITTLAPELTNGALEAALREDALRFASRADAQGRRVWLRNGQVEREGGLLPLPDRPTERAWATHAYEVPGGWRCWIRKRERGSYTQAFADLETGRFTPLTKSGWRPNAHHHVSREHALLTERAGKYTWKRLLVVEALTGKEVQPAANPPALILGPVGAGQMLCMRRTSDTEREIHLWDPMTGDSRAIEWSHEVPQRNLSISIRANLPDGRFLLELSSRSRAAADFRWLLAVFDRETGRAEVLTDTHARNGYCQPLMLTDDGALIAVEGGQRIVRHRGPGAREVLWPKPQ